MAQFARPDADDANPASWIPEVGGTLYGELDESVQSDTDFVSTASGTTGYCEVGLSAVTDPGVGTGHTLRVRMRRTNGAKDCTLVVSLYDDTTLIKSWNHVNPQTAFTTLELTFTAEETDTISGYGGALKVRLDATVNVSPGSAEVSWIELEVPDEPLDHYTLTPVEGGTYALTGADVGLDITHEIVPAGGTYAWTGATASLEKGSELVPVTASFDLTGAVVGFLHVREIVPATASFDLTGAAASLEFGRELVPAGGTYTLTGTDALLRTGHFHAHPGGSFTLTGAAVTLISTAPAKFFANATLQIVPV